MSAPLKLFVDHASQPSRAIIVFCRINKIPHEIVETRINRGDHLKDEFQKINPNKKIPAILHGDFNLAQSHSILRYLSRVFNVADNWYPKTDYMKAAKIDEYLDYHHTGTRKFSNLVFWGTFAPRMGLTVPASFSHKECAHEVERGLKFLNNVFLHTTPYIYTEKPSIADLSAYQELIQLKFAEYDYKKYDKVTSWENRMQQIPEIAQENKIFNKFLRAYKAKAHPKQ